VDSVGHTVGRRTNIWRILPYGKAPAVLCQRILYIAGRDNQCQSLIIVVSIVPG